MLLPIFHQLDSIRATKRGILINQLIPIGTCLILFAVFMGASHWIIGNILNPHSTHPIIRSLRVQDVLVGFFLYFVTAIDYALIIGRMQTKNADSQSRFIMNVMTCLGCFVGVTLVLLLWGFAKEQALFIIPLLIFAASVMVKLAYEGHEYFAHAPTIPQPIRVITVQILSLLFIPSRLFTFWMPEIGTPKTERLPYKKLALWSFMLPFIIGIDDLIGYMGAMTIYNAYGLLFGIYLADIVIDILIFVSPSFTKRLVESPLLSLLAAYAFLYLAYQSFTEALRMTAHQFMVTPAVTIGAGVGVLILVIAFDGLTYLLTGTHPLHMRGDDGERTT